MTFALIRSAGLAVAASASLCLAQGRLIAVDSSRALYQIDIATGVKTAIGTVSVNASTTAGLAYNPTTQTIYLTSTGNDSLYTLDLATGTATLVGAYGDPAVIMHGLEWDDSTGTLYGCSSHNNGLYTISTATGAATLIGTSGLTSFSNLGHDSIANVMYSTNSGADSFYRMDRATGATTLIGALTGPTNPNGLAFNKDDGRLYLVCNNTDSLYTIDTASGLATLIGAHGPSNLLGLVYLPAPVTPACYANCDGSTTPPVLNINDFICFTNLFAANDPLANCDGSTTPPTLNVNDFTCFLNAFAVGCT
ncbi:MAG: GC-type dockerin domain-anchored protein [Phycisphaerales bacterium]